MNPESYQDTLAKPLAKANFEKLSSEASIAKKEEALEQIMCAEAFATFERTARHQLNYATANRTTVDPDKIGLDIDVLSQFYLDGSDVAEPDSDSDDEMVQKHNLIKFHAGAGEESSCPDIGGLRCGFGFMEQKDRIFVSQCG